MDIVTRLKTFIDYLGVPVTQFADNCGIPRPTLSQLLNGRNKTVRDELIAKIHAAYPQLSVMWLMFGEGDAILDRADVSAHRSATSPAPSIASPSGPTGENHIGISASGSPASGSMHFTGDDAGSLFDESEDPSASKLGAPDGSVPQPASPIDFSFDLTPQHDNGANITREDVATEQHARADVDAVHGKLQQDSPRERTDAPAEGAPNQRRVVSIIVYYSDSSYQTFVPDEDSAASLPFLNR